jgi:hypothetical protein
MDALNLQYLGELVLALRKSPSSTIRGCDQDLLRRLKGWPDDKLFPVIDLMRLYCLHPACNEMFKGSDRGMSQIMESLGWLKDPNAPLSLCAMRFFCNCFCFPTNQFAMLEKSQVLCQKWKELKIAQSTNKNTRLALATACLNLTVAAGSFTKKKAALSDVVQLALEHLGSETEPEARYRLVACLGTAVVNDPNCKGVVSSGFAPLASKLTGDAKLTQAVQELKQACA